MAYTRSSLYSYVRDHLDIDETELTDTLLDAWAREGTNKIIRARERWPFLEYSWTLQTTSGQRDYDLTSFTTDLGKPEIDAITSLTGYERKLRWIGRDEGDAMYLPFQTNGGYATFFNVWNGVLRLYPRPIGESIEVRGYRKVDDWVGDTVGGKDPQPDMPSEMGDLVRLYLMGSAYLHQEDPEMSGLFMKEFVDELSLMKKRIGDTPAPQPFILNGRRRIYYPGRMAFPFD